MKTLICLDKFNDWASFEVAESQYAVLKQFSKDTDVGLLGTFDRLTKEAYLDWQSNMQDTDTAKTCANYIVNKLAEQGISIKVSGFASRGYLVLTVDDCR